MRSGDLNVFGYEYVVMEFSPKETRVVSLRIGERSWRERFDGWGLFKGLLGLERG